MNTTLLNLAAEMARHEGMPSPYLDDWKLPKSVPKYVRRQIIAAAETARERTTRWSHEVAREARRYD